jgi:hypothetical protein
MDKWILDEKKLTMELIDTGRVNGKLYDKPKSAIRRIARYFLLRGYSESRVERIIRKWHTLFPYYEYDNEGFTSIRNLIHQSKMVLKPYVNIDNVEIKKSEMEVIKNLPTKNLQKLAFGFLVYAKVLNIYYGGYFVYHKRINQLFLDSNVGYTGKTKQREQIDKLIELGLLRIDKDYVYDSPTVIFVGDDSEETVMVVKDFELLGLQLLSYLGDKSIKLKKCEYCGELMQVKDNRTKYHDECKEQAKRDKERDRQKEKRKVAN